MQEGAVFAHPNWVLHGSEEQKGMWFLATRRPFAFRMLMSRGPIRGEDGAVLRFTINLSVRDNAYEPLSVQLTGDLTYQKATERCSVEWRLRNDDDGKNRVQLWYYGGVKPAAADGLLVNVKRALQTSGFRFVARDRSA